MSQRTLHKCDACGHEEENKKQDNFQTITISFGNTYSSYSVSSKFQFERENSIELCAKCLEKIGIKRIPGGKQENPPPPATADQLYNLIYEIIQDCLSNQQ